MYIYIRTYIVIQLCILGFRNALSVLVKTKLETIKGVNLRQRPEPL